MDWKIPQLEPTKYDNSALCGTARSKYDYSALCAAIIQGGESRTRNAHKRRSRQLRWHIKYVGPIGCAILEEQPGIVRMLVAAGAKPDKDELSLIYLRGIFVR
jgi:hypothetical protein